MNDEPEQQHDDETPAKSIFNPDGTVWVPAFEGQRPPFQKGNRFRLERPYVASGWRSPSLVDKAAAPIIAALKATEGLEHLRHPMFAAELQAYVRAQARADLYRAWVDAQTTKWAVTPRPVHAPAERLHDLQRAADNWGEKIGLTPIVPPDVAERIAKARRNLDRKRMRKQLQADVKDALRRQTYPQDYPDDAQ